MGDGGADPAIAFRFFVYCNESAGLRGARFALLVEDLAALSEVILVCQPQRIN